MPFRPSGALLTSESESESEGKGESESEGERERMATAKLALPPQLCSSVARCFWS